MRHAVLDAIVRSAVEATAATSGWLVAATDDGPLVVRAAFSDDGAGEAIGTIVPDDAPAALALALGQPAARLVDPSDVSARGAGAAGDVPTSLLTVPCGDAAGVLEVADKRGGSPFTIDDIELVTLLAEIAGAALAERDDDLESPDVEELAAELRRLHTTNRARYRFVARVVAGLLGAG